MITLRGFVVGQEQVNSLRVESHGCATGTEQARDHVGVSPFPLENSNEKEKKKREPRIPPRMAGLGGFRLHRAPAILCNPPGGLNCTTKP